MEFLPCSFAGVGDAKVSGLRGNEICRTCRPGVQVGIAPERRVYAAGSEFSLPVVTTLLNPAALNATFRPGFIRMRRRTAERHFGNRGLPFAFIPGWNEGGRVFMNDASFSNRNGEN